jgi:hypothetical protein
VQLLGLLELAQLRDAIARQISTRESRPAPHELRRFAVDERLQESADVIRGQIVWI